MLGSVGIKNSVYALPASEQAHEDLNWVLREIVEGGGDASLVEARFVEGLGDEEVKEMFRSARDADYQEIAGEARELARLLPRKGEVSDEKRGGRKPCSARARLSRSWPSYMPPICGTVTRLSSMTSRKSSGSCSSRVLGGAP